MSGKDESSQLIIEITNLKKDLNRAYKKRKSLIHPEVVAISMQLDLKIVQYMKMKNKNKPDDEVREMTRIY